MRIIYKATPFKHYCPKIKYRQISYTMDHGDTVSDAIEWWVFKRPYLFGLIGKRKWINVCCSTLVGFGFIKALEKCKKQLPKKKKLIIKSNNQNELR